MKKKWTWSRIMLVTAVGLLSALMLSAGSLSIADHKGTPHGKPGGGEDPPPPPPPADLPDVRYRIQFIEQPTNATAASYVWINDMNNLGQVVGIYSSTAGRRPFLYNPLVSTDQGVDLNAIVTAGIPDGWRFRSALAINDHMVVVGNMEEISTGQRRPVAIDLLAVDPVVDLLPDVGVDHSHGFKINENGDILGVVDLGDGLWASWIFNPGLYGDPAQRTPRDGTPLDMSGEMPDLLPLSGSSPSYDLNNPVGTSPAQIAGVDADRVAFRYTLGDAEPELFPELNLSNLTPDSNLNDSGTFTGYLYYPREGKRKYYLATFRYNTELDELPQRSDGEIAYMPIDMNSSGDLLLWDALYRDDWGDRYVKINDLVVGTDPDMAAWSSGSAYVYGINDRPEPSSAGQITGDFVYDDGRRGVFVLTP